MLFRSAAFRASHEEQLTSLTDSYEKERHRLLDVISGQSAPRAPASMVVTETTPSVLPSSSGRDPATGLTPMVLPAWPGARAPPGLTPVPRELAPPPPPPPVASQRYTVEAFNLVDALGVDPDGFSSAAESI